MLLHAVVESESDASAKQGGAKATNYKKVPAEFSPQEPGCELQLHHL